MITISSQEEFDTLFNILENVEIYDNVKVIFDLAVRGNLIIQNHLTVEGDLYVRRSLIIWGNLIIRGNLTVVDNLIVWGNLIIGGYLSVVGDMTLEGYLSIIGDMTIRGNWQCNRGQIEQLGEQRKKTTMITTHNQSWDAWDAFGQTMNAYNRARTSHEEQDWDAYDQARDAFIQALNTLTLSSPFDSPDPGN